MQDTEQIICNDSKNLGKYVQKNAVNLSIVVPPYIHLENYYNESSDLQKKEGTINKTEDYLNNMSEIINEITKVTKPGGICCLILTEDKDPQSSLMIPIGSAIISKIILNSSLRSMWSFSDKILWIKSPKDAIESLNKMDDVMVNFDQTPFSEIHILIRNGSNFQSIDRLQRIEELHLAEEKKNELMDNLWFIQPKSEKGYVDHLPKELIIRLIMLFSKECDLVLDPFARHGITSIAAKTLKRHFICLDQDIKNNSIAKKRYQDFINNKV